MKKLLLLMMGLTLTLTACSKDDDNDVAQAPRDTFGTVIENSTEAALQIDVNNDGDLADAIQRTNQTKNGNVTSNGDWIISNDINPDFLGNNNGFWVIDEGSYYLGVLITGTGNNAATVQLAFNYALTCSILIDTDLGVTGVISNHSKETLTVTYSGVDGALVGFDGKVDIVVSYLRDGNQINFSEQYYQNGANIDGYGGYYAYNPVSAGVEVYNLPDCNKSSQVFNTFLEYKNSL